MTKLQILERDIINCRLCPRLVEYREHMARTKRRAYRDSEYWGRPVPGFGDPKAQLLVVGLAPGAHGANRTGRVFTGDRSGDFLFRAMYETGFASQPTSLTSSDGLRLLNAYVLAAVRCAPPDNKPSVDEIRMCCQYLEREIELLRRVRVVIALGRLAFHAYLTVLRSQGKLKRRSAFAFGHDQEHCVGPDQPVLISSYHPSQQNTSTGLLTQPMLQAVFQRANRLLAV